MNKYRYQRWVADHNTFLVLSLGEKTGASTRSRAMRATAKQMNKQIQIARMNRDYRNFEPESVDYTPYEAVVLIAPSYIDALPLASTISAFGTSVYTVSIIDEPAYSDEYERALQIAHDKMIESFLSEEALNASIAQVSCWAAPDENDEFE